jgi:hypothetical protein
VKSKGDKSVFTCRANGEDVRSIQIGLRNDAVKLLMDPAVVLKITDVTDRFAACGAALAAGDGELAALSLWPDTRSAERPLADVPKTVQATLKMERKSVGNAEKVAFASAARQPSATPADVGAATPEDVGDVTPVKNPAGTSEATAEAVAVNAVGHVSMSHGLHVATELR